MPNWFESDTNFQIRNTSKRKKKNHKKTIKLKLVVTKINCWLRKRYWNFWHASTHSQTGAQQDWSSHNRNTIIISVVRSDLFYTNKIGRFSFKRFPCSFSFCLVLLSSTPNLFVCLLVLCWKRSNFKQSKFEWYFYICTLVFYVLYLFVEHSRFCFWMTNGWLNYKYDSDALIQIERELRLHTS